LIVPFLWENADIFNNSVIECAAFLSFKFHCGKKYVKQNWLSEVHAE